MTKEKQFKSTDFDHVGFHLDTVNDLLKLIDICHDSNKEGLPITSEKLDELKHYTSKLKRFVSSIK